MSLDEGVSRFIGRIYESVYDADAWQAMVREINRRTGSHLAFIASVDLRFGEYSRADFCGPETSKAVVGTEEYFEAMAAKDPSLIWASEHPQAGMCDTARLMPDDEFRRMEYVRWQEDRLGTVHWRVFYTPPVDDLSFALSLHPPAGAGPAAPETGKLHRLLFEHMERALRLAARPPDLAGTSEPLVILDTHGRVLSMSPRAETLVTRGDGLRIERRRLSCLSADASARFDCAIASAIRTGSMGGAGGGVRLPRRSGKPDWLALVSPYPSFLEHLPVRTPAAVVRLIETESTAVLSPSHAELFELSPREIDVAQALLNGHSVESLCALLQISRNTAKVHLQSLFRKTSTSRQSELVHLLSNIVRN